MEDLENNRNKPGSRYKRGKKDRIQRVQIQTPLNQDGRLEIPFMHCYTLFVNRTVQTST